MKFGEVRRRLQSEGFEIISQNGSHEQWKKPGSPDALQLPEKTVTLSVIKQ
jgi:predicted RNA binding protein YcfA (HicA-like mRNA interferase family)